MVERTVTFQNSTQSLPDAPINPSVQINPKEYKVVLRATLKGTPSSIIIYLKGLLTNNSGWPGYRAKILRQYQPERNQTALIQYKEEKLGNRYEGKRFVLESSPDGKWFDDAFNEKKQISWKVRAFDMIYPIRELGTLEITNDDLQGADFTLTQKMKQVE